MAASTDTIAAMATPSGESAVAVIRVSGPRARALAGDFLGTSPVPRHASRAVLRARGGEVLDDAIVTFFAAPASYTGEDVIEISGHGNPVIARRILEDLFDRGCRPAEAGEFTRRAFLNGKMDLSQAEAVMDLIRARSDRAIDAAGRQLHGSLSREIAHLSDALLAVLARAEAYIDFPEEDLPPEDQASMRSSIESVLGPLSSLLATQRYGELLRAGVRTVLIGETNAGKSSLLNRLLGRDRAIVSPLPGTTRDFIEEPRTLHGHCIRFVDTAGLNPSPGSVEGLGIERSMTLAAGADIVLLVVDSSLPFPALDTRLIGTLDASRAAVVWNKSDLAPPGAIPEPLPPLPSVSISAATGRGVGHLETLIIDMVEKHRKDPGPELVAINARHAHDLGECRAALERALLKLDRRESDEFLAADLRTALGCLGRIGGKFDNEEMLDKLFAEFCIGK